MSFRYAVPRLIAVAVFAAAFLPSSGAIAAGFERTGDLNVARANPMVVKLADGRVLVAGGRTTGNVITRTAEIYDPSTGQFTLTTGSMAVDRIIGTAALLPSGKVLIVGGQGDTGGPRTTAELFDPATGLFTDVSSTMSGNRVWPLATRLDNGKVLVSHGCCTGGNSADLYDPNVGPTGTFTLTAGQPSVSFSNSTGTATKLANGKVLVAGDWGTDRKAQVYDPATDSFTTTSGLMVVARTASMATRLTDGKVLIAGATGASGNTAEVFDPAAGTFAATAGVMGAARSQGYIAPLPDGRVLVAGGASDWAGAPNSSADIFDPATGTFTAIGPMTVARRQLNVANPPVLNDGRILFAGGATGPESSPTFDGPTKVSELYVPDGYTPPAPGAPAPGGSGDEVSSPVVTAPEESTADGSTKAPVRSGRMRVASGGSKLAVRIRVPGPGRLMQRGVLVGSGGSRSSAAPTACRSSVPVTRERTIRIGCRLNASTLRRLQASSLRLRVTVSFKPADGSAQSLSRTVRLAQTGPSFTG
ncbi:MAG: Kelch repeat-containing protein [Solirubrobacterales bacterium]